MNTFNLDLARGTYHLLGSVWNEGIQNVGMEKSAGIEYVCFDTIEE